MKGNATVQQGDRAPLARFVCLAGRLTTRQLLVLFSVGLLFAMALEKAGDPDLFWHLKTGQWMLAHRAVPRTGLWSWAGENLPWTTHEWLFQVVVAALFSLAGWGGVILLKAALIAAAFAVVLDHARQRSGSVGSPALLALISGILTIPFWSERPQLVTYAFTAWLLRLLWEWDTGRRRHLWGVPPLVLLWANFHGAYFLALVLLATYFAAELLKRFWQCENGCGGSRPRHLAAVAGASVALAAVNPHGVGILLYPFQYIGFTSLTHFVAEWFPPNFQQWPMRLFALFILAVVGTLAASPNRPRPADLLLVLLLIGMSLLAVRNVPLALIGLTPILAEHLRALARRATLPPAESHSVGGAAIALNWTLLLLLLGLCIARLPIGKPTEVLLNTEKQPVAAVAWVKSRPLPGRMCNFYDWGGYLIWELSPRYQVFVDGRTDVYGQELMAEYHKLWQLKPGWRQVLDQYQIDWVFWKAQAPLTEALALCPGWRQVYRDDLAVIFVRQNSLHPTAAGRDASPTERGEEPMVPIGGGEP
ncbi:MAG: hypothetical protein QHJ73_01235 [Armatimonadota bacterium]|nr:hypothetical protein [Armatimonadota bacterium]